MVPILPLRITFLHSFLHHISAPVSIHFTHIRGTVNLIREKISFGKHKNIRNT